MTDFTYDELTEGQQKAIDTVLDAVNNKTDSSKRLVTICGAAGTGKTTLTKVLLKKLDEMEVDGVIITAPTHAAKKVLTKLSGKGASTIHSVLKINPTNYEDNQLFEQKDVPDLASARVLIVDECSMVDGTLFDITMSSVPGYCAIIGIGDKSQIRPVDKNKLASISRFFTDKRFNQVELTEVKRYEDSPILDVATDIRNGQWIYPKQDANGSGVIQALDFVTLMKHYFSIVKTPEDLFNNRFAAYTNKTVNKLNDIIRKRIYNTTEPFIKGEIVVMQEPLIKKVNYEKQSFSEIIFNNGQYVRVLNVMQKPITVSNRGMPKSIVVNAYSIEVETYDDDEEYNKAWINIIVDDNEKNKFFFYQGDTAQTYRSDDKLRKNWSDYWHSKGLFHDVKPLPASTLHKTQGSSVDNIFLFTGCIHKAPIELAQELLYVGATRARNNVFYI